MAAPTTQAPKKHRPDTRLLLLILLLLVCTALIALVIHAFSKDLRQQADMPAPAPVETEKRPELPEVSEEEAQPEEPTEETQPDEALLALFAQSDALAA